MERNIYKVKDIVANVLLKDERAREDDFYLYAQVIFQLKPEYTNTSLSDFLYNAKRNKVTPFESVRRCRAKLQAENPDLRPSKIVQQHRAENEKIMKDFSLDFCQNLDIH